MEVDMGSTDVGSDTSTEPPRPGTIDMKLESVTRLPGRELED